MAITDRVTTMVLPLLEPLGLHLYDVEINGGTLRITVDGDEGVNLDQLAAATRAVSHVFDEDDPMPGGYTLEVSSPGLERKLRTPQHFEAALGDVVNVKLGPHIRSERRVRGELTSADADSIVILDDDGNEHRLHLADVTKAVTVFEWGPSPKPGSAEAKSAKNAKRSNVTTPAAQAQNPENAAGTSGPSDSERRAAAQ